VSQKKTCDYILYNNFNNKCPITIIFGTVSSQSMRHRKMVSFPTRVGIISVFCLVMFGHKFGISCCLTGLSLKGIPELHTQSNKTEAKKIILFGGVNYVAVLVCAVSSQYICPVWARDFCRISTPHLLAERRMRRLNQASSAIFGVVCFSGLCLVFVVCLFMSSVLYFLACTNVNDTPWPNCADVPLRIYSLTQSSLFYGLRTNRKE